MIEIPALIYKSESYPVEFQGRVPKIIRFLPPTKIHKEWDVYTDSGGNISIILNWEAGRLVSVGHPFQVTEWYYSGPHVCFWNPRENRPAYFLIGNYRNIKSQPTDGCQNEAVLRVGSKEIWHLCEECAKLPRFKRFRVRKSLMRNRSHGV